MLSIAYFFRHLCLIPLLFLCASVSYAGVDIHGPVQRVQIAADGKLWFSMDTTPVATYCRPGWNSMTMYIPKESAEYPYYFAMLMTAVAKGKNVTVANISIYDGSVSCDITKTGYGLVLFQ
jgi:hypothetical protein